MNQKEQLMAKKVNPNHYRADQANRNWTTPRSYGTFSIPDEFVYGRKLRNL